MITLILLSVVGLALGLVVGRLWARGQNAASRARADLLERDLAALKAEAADRQQQLSELTGQRDEARTRARMLEDQLAALKENADRQSREQREEGERRITELKDRHAEQLAHLEQQQKEQAAMQAELVREQIKNASQALLKERSAELAKANETQLSAILNPLHESLKRMREAVEKSEGRQTEALDRLSGFIEAGRKQAAALGDRADSLARALTGENKVQGSFGELRLRTLLQNMGLKEGIQFDEQVTLSDESGRTLHDEESGRRMIPDVVLHFPDRRDVVIDSKVSLKAFEDYHNATTPAERSDALARHLASVRAHVKELAAKDYSRYAGDGKAHIDFVVMYIYNESALQLALANDTKLWKDAYDQGVVITGSQNMYMMLRVLEMTWRQVRQVENQANIIKWANEIVNRVQLFYERLCTVSDQFDKTKKAFDELGKTAASGGRGIVSAAQKLVQYGASENPKRKLRLPRVAEADDEAEA